MESSLLQSRRLLHGRGRCYEGLEQVTIDYHPGAVMLTLFAPLEMLDELLAELQGCIDGSNQPQTAMIIQRRFLEGTPSELFCGVLPEPAIARIGDSVFALQYMSKQNIGFFLDMAPGRDWLQQRVSGKKVLNLFSYTCALSVLATRTGATEVINMDMSKAALSVGRQNHLLNDLPAKQHGVQFLAHDIMKSFGKLDKLGPYDIIICDPPSFQKGSFVAEQHYRKLLSRMLPMLAPSAEVLLCLNAPEMSPAFITSLTDELWPGVRFVQRLPEHPDYPEAERDRGLKLLHYINEAVVTA
ncbi:23S rRNA (cytosine1962-C5)-methyltransferase [Sinobacterium caligoides]|uniref:23S rRNA (Cytosine1962-C5)-methyltransferase n=1 Tax=Sinobacterium caligoides TaxID=933926 RepID=A0A3N2DZF2_9GAMM|nr:23S rRNA (cytosine1962-C5)-methyltransferase [Sinobacterium caligoides]